MTLPGHEQEYRQLKQHAQACTRCPLYKSGTQTVFGSGNLKAPFLFVGEQPGDQEDRQGEPFVGPAGKVLRESLQSAGYSEDEIYITNAVKHFKWKRADKRRLHQKPNLSEMRACRSWLVAEMDLVDPQLIVALGVTAAVSLLDQEVTLKDTRGRILLGPESRWVYVTTHPSALIRISDRQLRRKAIDGFIAHLRRARGARKTVRCEDFHKTSRGIDHPRA